MRRTSIRSLSLASALALPLLAACGGGGGGGGGADAGPFSYAPSNLPKSLAVPLPGNVEATGNCTVYTKDGIIDCANAADFSYTTFTQNDANQTKVAVFGMNKLTVGANGVVRVVGDFPALFLVATTATIGGQILATPGPNFLREENAGGFSAPIAGTYSAGQGPGGGGTLDESTHTGAGGGGHCGAGGPGLAAATNGGKTYGTPNVIPLIGGASGATAYGEGGAGGGAIQVSAGQAVLLLAGSLVNAGGAGGQGAGGGGGAGGAILLEAPSVKIAGTLAANGGAGGANDPIGKPVGENAHPDATAAKGGVADSGNPQDNGGDGAAGATKNGAPGTYGGGKTTSALKDAAGGGGGGAGRIRLNSQTGTADVQASAVFSPAIGDCASQGTLPK